MNRNNSYETSPVFLLARSLGFAQLCVPLTRAPWLSAHDRTMRGDRCGARPASAAASPWSRGLPSSDFAALGDARAALFAFVGPRGFGPPTLDSQEHPLWPGTCQRRRHQAGFPQRGVFWFPPWPRAMVRGMTCGHAPESAKLRSNKNSNKKSDLGRVEP